ncbi:MAG: LytTR family DNA-binding domain-containing protein [Chitinophagales bacterium]|nr:LytTR family DNA-binding domain-containing protein [Chitinophagales bacterium]
MIRAIIIEDEEFAVRRLKKLLQEIEEPVDIIAELKSIQQAVQWLLMNQCDLIFLDINLSDGNAFKIFEQVEIRTPIVFTTAYHEYALRAFEQYSIDYLLKPIAREKLKNSLLKFHNLKQSNTETANLQNIQELIGLMQNKPKRFMVSIGSKVKIIDSSEVAYFTSGSKMIFLHTFKGKRYSIDSSLKQLQLSLPIQEFFRVNRQYLINRKAIQDLQYYSATRVKVNLDPMPPEDVILAREKIGGFKKWLMG